MGGLRKEATGTVNVMFGMVLEADGVSGSAHDTGALTALGDLPGCARAHDFFTKLLKYIYHIVSKDLLTAMSPTRQVVRNLHAKRFCCRNVVRTCATWIRKHFQLRS